MNPSIDDVRYEQIRSRFLDPVSRNFCQYVHDCLAQNPETDLNDQSYLQELWDEWEELGS